MRLIDADAVKLEKGFFEKVNTVPKFYEWLSEQPTIQPSEYGGCWGCKCDPVKHGKWEFEPGIMYCSSCGWLYEYFAGLEEEYNYCPNCGADMRGEDN